MANSTIKPTNYSQLNNKTNNLWPNQPYTEIIPNSTVHQNYDNSAVESKYVQYDQLNSNKIIQVWPTKKKKKKIWST